MSKTVDQLIHQFKVDIAYNQWAFDNNRRETPFFTKYEEDKEKDFEQAISQLLTEAKLEENRFCQKVVRDEPSMNRQILKMQQHNAELQLTLKRKETK